jgi:hypothetical protein
MSSIAPACEPEDFPNRSQFRLTMFADDPVQLLFNLDGIDIDPIAERLDTGKASFVCSKYFDMFYEGQMIGPAVLVLEDDGMAVVYPVVKSKNWPLVDVEFMEISEKDRRMITQFLARIRQRQFVTS